MSHTLRLERYQKVVSLKNSDILEHKSFKILKHATI
jgi:hypothetical protein